MAWCQPGERHGMRLACSAVAQGALLGWAVLLSSHQADASEPAETAGCSGVLRSPVSNTLWGWSRRKERCLRSPPEALSLWGVMVSKPGAAGIYWAPAVQHTMVPMEQHSAHCVIKR